MDLPAARVMGDNVVLEAFRRARLLGIVARAAHGAHRPDQVAHAENPGPQAPHGRAEGRRIHFHQLLGDRRKGNGPAHGMGQRDIRPGQLVPKFVEAPPQGAHEGLEIIDMALGAVFQETV